MKDLVRIILKVNIPKNTSSNTEEPIHIKAEISKDLKLIVSHILDFSFSLVFYGHFS